MGLRSTYDIEDESAKIQLVKSLENPQGCLFDAGASGATDAKMVAEIHTDYQRLMVIENDWGL